MKTDTEQGGWAFDVQLSSQAAQAWYVTVDTMLHNELFIDFVFKFTLVLNIKNKSRNKFHLPCNIVSFVQFGCKCLISSMVLACRES